MRQPKQYRLWNAFLGALSTPLEWLRDGIKSAQRALTQLLLILGAPFGRLRQPSRHKSAKRTARPDALNGRNLLVAAPAILCGLLLPIAMAWGWYLGNTRVVEKYRTVASRALSQEDRPCALLCYRRLAELEPSEPHHRYVVAMIAGSLGDEVRAESIMRALSQEGSVGYRPAHLWLAKKTLASKSVPTSDELFRVAERLKIAREDVTLAAEAEPELARLYLLVGRLADVEADRRLQDIVLSRPELRLILAEQLAQRGRRAESRRHATDIRPQFEKRLATSPGDAEAQVRLAATYVLAGEYERAIRLLAQIVDEPKVTGSVVGIYLRAHGSWADDAAESLQLGGDEKRRIYEHALQAFLKHGENRPDRDLQLARLSDRLDDAAGAERFYLQAVQNAVPLQLEFARFYFRRGRAEDARRQAGAALEKLRSQLLHSPQDNVIRLLTADAAVLVGEYAEAVTLLEEGRRNAPDPGFNTAICRTYLRWWRASLQELGVEKADWTLLDRALIAEPNNLDLITELSQLIRRPETGEKAHAQLVDAASRGDASAVVHMILGTESLAKNDMTTGMKHLELALKLDPRMLDAANNLAFALIRTVDPDALRALELVEFALQHQPTNPEFLETRARVRIQLGRWTEALQDLERCLSAMSNRPDFHRLIAEAYRHEGLIELAARHEKKAVTSAMASP